MLIVGGLAFLVMCVLGSYLASGGALGPLLNAMPFEMLSIGGSATGAFLMANSLHDVKHTLAGMLIAVKGPRFKREHYLELLTVLFQLLRTASQKGLLALEADIETPRDSTLFQAFPLVARNHRAVTLICDYMRMVGMNADDPHQIEDVLSRELKKELVAELHPSHALQAMSDGLPTLGIVAAVLGVIKTMGHINESPVVLGEMIGGALVGTFLGVLLSYGVIGPIAARLNNVVREEATYYEIIRAVLVAHLHGNAPQVSVESGRKIIPAHLMPGFADLETRLQQVA